MYNVTLMINIQQGIKNKIYIYIYIFIRKIEQLTNCKV